MKDRLRTAITLTKTLSDFHDGHVVHNSLSLENIILDKIEGDCNVTLIDLSRSIIISDGFKADRDETFAEAAKQKDLRDLGHVLNSLFCMDTSMILEEELISKHDKKSEESDDIDSISPKKRGKLPKTDTAEGLPLFLTSLISTLILTGDNERAAETYGNAKNVLLDLKVALNGPQIFLKPCNWKDVSTMSRMKTPHNALFYGRRSELSILLHSLDSVMTSEGKPAMTLVSGCAGAG